MSFKKATDFVLSHQKEAVKQYIAYDGSSRMEYNYVALADAAHGEPCMVTQYVYDGASARVIKTKESLSTWNSAWDV